jgi:RNA polymerase sigma factor (sigma-70 family)
LFAVYGAKKAEDERFMMTREAQPGQAEARQILLALDGNGEAFCELVEPQRRSLYLKALSMVGDQADAEEVVQNAVVKAFSNLSQFRQESQFRTWLMSITTNEARMWLRTNRKARHELLNWLHEDGNQIPLEIEDPRESRAVMIFVITPERTHC